MTLTVVLDLWRACLQPASKFLFEEVVVKPVHGLVEIGQGLTLAAPELIQAVQHAIDLQLPPEARAKIAEGLARIKNGWRLARWPLAEMVLVLVFGWYGVGLAVTGAIVFAAGA